MVAKKVMFKSTKKGNIGTPDRHVARFRGPCPGLQPRGHRCGGSSALVASPKLFRPRDTDDPRCECCYLDVSESDPKNKWLIITQNQDSGHDQPFLRVRRRLQVSPFVGHIAVVVKTVFGIPF